MSDEPPFRRRIDRVTGEDFLDDLAERSTAEVRQMRDDCRDEEARLSYARRILHGQLDIARAELARRDSGDARSLMDALGTILSDHAGDGAPRSAANAQVYSPEHEQGRRIGDRVLDGMPLGTLPDLSDEELITAVTGLTEQEHVISALRRTVMAHLDRLQEDLVGRYRDGAFTIEELLPPTGR